MDTSEHQYIMIVLQECLQAAGDQQERQDSEERANCGGVWSCSWSLDSGDQSKISIINIDYYS